VRGVSYDGRDAINGVVDDDHVEGEGNGDDDDGHHLLFDGLSHDGIIDFLQIHRPLIGEIEEEIVRFLGCAAPAV
jgi:hypothetical protein